MPIDGGQVLYSRGVEVDAQPINIPPSYRREDVEANRINDNEQPHDTRERRRVRHARRADIIPPSRRNRFQTPPYDVLVAPELYDVPPVPMASLQNNAFVAVDPFRPSVVQSVQQLISRTAGPDIDEIPVTLNEAPAQWPYYGYNPNQAPPVIYGGRSRSPSRSPPARHAQYSRQPRPMAESPCASPGGYGGHHVRRRSRSMTPEPSNHHARRSQPHHAVSRRSRNPHRSSTYYLRSRSRSHSRRPRDPTPPLYPSGSPSRHPSPRSRRPTYVLVHRSRSPLRRHSRSRSRRSIERSRGSPSPRRHHCSRSRRSRVSTIEYSHRSRSRSSSPTPLPVIIPSAPLILSDTISERSNRRYRRTASISRSRSRSPKKIVIPSSLPVEEGPTAVQGRSRSRSSSRPRGRSRTPPHSATRIGTLPTDDVPLGLRGRYSLSNSSSPDETVVPGSPLVQRTPIIVMQPIAEAASRSSRSRRSRSRSRTRSPRPFRPVHISPSRSWIPWVPRSSCTPTPPQSPSGHRKSDDNLRRRRRSMTPESRNRSHSRHRTHSRSSRRYCYRAYTRSRSRSYSSYSRYPHYPPQQFNADPYMRYQPAGSFPAYLQQQQQQQQQRQWMSHSISTFAYVSAFILDTVPRQIYLHFLLRLPYLYFSRVKKIFEEAELSMPEIKRMALEMGVAKDIMYGVQGVPQVASSFTNLKSTWESFIESLMREWKTLNIISVLLLSAILTILQIESAASDPITRYSALLSLVCALMSLLYGCMYIIRFGTMRKTHRAAEWASEAQKTRTSIIWNVWVLLAMPAAWLAWALILYLTCIMAFVWRTGTVGNSHPLPDSVWPRIIISVVFGLGIVYFFLIISTLKRYGEAMDMAWKARVMSWTREIFTNQQPIVVIPDGYYPHRNIHRSCESIRDPKSDNRSPRSASVLDILSTDKERSLNTSNILRKDSLVAPPDENGGFKTMKVFDLSEAYDPPPIFPPEELVKRDISSDLWQNFTAELYTTKERSSKACKLLTEIVQRWNSNVFFERGLQGILCNVYYPQDKYSTPILSVYIADCTVRNGRLSSLHDRFGPVPDGALKVNFLNPNHPGKRIAVKN